jgi:sulfhydrogenase subunit gamma (sulfur reductase)
MTYPAVVKKIIAESSNTNTYTLAFTDKEKQKNFTCAPGQFMMIGVFGIGEAALSICKIHEDGSFSTTVRNVGNVTNAIFQLKEGDRLTMRGPYGTGWPVQELKGKDILIVAGGIGLPPLRGIIDLVQKNRKNYGHLEIIYGSRTPEDMVFKYEFGQWRQIKNCRFDLTVDTLTLGSHWDCKIGLVTSCFPEMKTRNQNSIALLCGPEIMMRFAAKCLETIGFRDNQIYVSLERRMKCGIGKCGHCQIGPKYVCKDGPVFSYDEIRPYIHPL